MSPLFLTADEVSELTGYKLPARQRKWLDSHGYIYERAATGRPVILRAHITQRLNGAAERDPVTINLAAISRRA